jgi:phage I-like protein
MMNIKDLLICEAHELSSQALDNGRLELCVALTGEWKSRKMTVTQEHLQQMADSFAKEGRDILFDYDHKCLGGFFSEADSRAAGWGKAVRVEDGKLYVEMEPTPRGREAIENGEYKYLSPVYEFQRLNRVTGKKEKDWRLHSVAFTNTPFLLELPAIKNDENDGEKPMEELLKLLGCADEAEATAKINAMKSEISTLQAEKSTLQAKLNEQEVDLAVNQKKLLPAQKALALKLINQDRGLYDEFLNAAPKVDVTQEVPIPKAEGNGLDKFAEVKSFGDLLANHELAAQMQKDDPKRYAELHKRWMKDGN